MADFATIQSTGPGKWSGMRIAQMLAMQSIHGGALNSPTLTGLDALRVLGYWWRQRGRKSLFWKRALDKLKATGLEPKLASINKVLTEEQSEIVWDAAAEAATDLEKIKSSRNLSPQFFQVRQSTADAKAMGSNYLKGKFKERIPPLLVKPKKQPTPAKVLPIKPPPFKLPVVKVPPGLFPKRPPKLKIPKLPPPPILPKRPRLKLGKFGWIVVAVLVSREFDKREGE